MKKRQIIESDEVVAELGGTSFMTARGSIVEGNYQVGDQVPIVYDRIAKRWIPAYKRRRNIPGVLYGVNVQTRRVTMSCEVELIDVPLFVPPCRWYPEGIHEGEVEGVDYFKTYFRVVNQGDCVSCTEDWTICDTDELNEDILDPAPNRCQPFYFYNPALPYREYETHPPEDDPNNHCVYSMWSCQAELLSIGEDDDGRFIIWKAYTEWSNQGPEIVDYWSRNGLGWTKFGFMLRSSDGSVVCIADEEIQVDCCEKDADQRALTLWWESIPGMTCTGQPFMFFGDAKWCEVPDLVDTWLLYRLWQSYYCGFNAFPQIQGNCIPISWSLIGPGSLMATEGNSNEYLPPENPYHCEDVMIIAEDRCGTRDTVLASCCSTNTSVPMEIGCTTVSMQCGASQTLYKFGGGCPPYTWSLSGGGTLVPDPDDPAHTTAVYTAPPDNPNCGSNATITLRDCCGLEATLQIAVSCYVVPGAVALTYADWAVCEACHISGVNYVVGRTFTGRAWDCYGASMHDCTSGCALWYCDWRDPYNPCANGVGCSVEWWDPGGNCYTHECGPPGTGGAVHPCAAYVDRRTPYMLAGGCCPIDPRTGLPM